MQANISIEVRATIIGLHKSGLNKTQISEETGLNEQQSEDEEIYYEDTNIELDEKSSPSTSDEEVDDNTYDRYVEDGLEYDGPGGEIIYEDNSGVKPKNVIMSNVVNGKKKKRKKKKKNKKTSHEKNVNEESLKLFLSEVDAGDTADLISNNQHIQQSRLYHDLGRRFAQKDYRTGVWNKGATTDSVLWTPPQKTSLKTIARIAKVILQIPEENNLRINDDIMLKKINYVLL